MPGAESWHAAARTLPWGEATAGEERDSVMNTVIVVVFAFGGFATIGYSASQAFGRLLFAARSTSATGTVVAQQAVGRPTMARSEVGMTYRPIVTFVDRDGREVRFQSDVGFTPPRHRPGDTVTVRYDSRRPSHAQIAGDASFLAPTVCLVIGLCFLGLAGVSLIFP